MTKKMMTLTLATICCICGLAILFAQEKAFLSPEYRAYNNYDFRAGEKIVFEDDFRADRDGEFPAHWDLAKGQAVVNKVMGVPALAITDGNYGKVFPRIKVKQYLPAEFTVEFDHAMLSANKAYGLVLFFADAAGKEARLTVNDFTVLFNSPTKNLSATLTEDIRAKKYLDRWNHIAVAYRSQQMKVYVNQYRVLVVPNAAFTPVSLMFGGIASQKAPLVFTNVKVAEGGDMNMLQKLVADGRLVMHGIRFDYDKATIKPESMGLLSEISKLMSENGSMNFEIQGHTDSDGEDGYNLKLSQARADAVKSSLVQTGIGTARLTAKGYGKSNPITDNGTPEGKANNRRVELVVKK